MGRNRKTYSETLKNEVALEALKESRTVNEIAAEYQISPSMVTKWKKEFVLGRTKGPKELADMQKKLDETTKQRDAAYQEIGKQKMMMDLIKKKLNLKD